MAGKTTESTPPASVEPTLAGALVALQRELPTVHKGKTAKVPTKNGGSYSYDYADLADVTAAVMPLLVKHGLSFACRPRRCEDGVYELVGVLRHTSGETDEGSLPIRGSDPQAIGSAITYARRYLLGCMTGVVTDADDDGAAATQEAQQPAQQRPPQQPAKSPLEAARDLAWAAWRRKGGVDDMDVFARVFAEGNDGLLPGNANAEQLTAWAGTYAGHTAGGQS